jgi:hypothetical protein
MQTSRWRSGEAIIIPAGTTLPDFCRLIAEGGGKVYLENSLLSSTSADLPAD